MSYSVWIISALLALAICFHVVRHIAWRRHRDGKFNCRPRVPVEASHRECTERVPISMYAEVWHELAKIIGIHPECLRRSDTIDEIRGPLHTFESHIEGVEEMLDYKETEPVLTFGQLVDAAVRYRVKEK